MLTEAYQSYKDFVSHYPQLLTNTATENLQAYYRSRNKEEREVLLAVLVYQNWGELRRICRQNREFFSEDFCYDWYIHSLMYLLQHPEWMNSKEDLKSSPNAAQQMLNTVLKSTRNNAYVASSRDCRKANHAVMQVEEGVAELSSFRHSMDNLIGEWDIQALVRGRFHEKNFFGAFAIDLLSWQTGLSCDRRVNKRGVSRFWLLWHQISSKYLQTFAYRYSLPYKQVTKAWEECLHYSAYERKKRLIQENKSLHEELMNYVD